MARNEYKAPEEEEIKEEPKQEKPKKQKPAKKESRLGKAFMSIIDGSILTRDNVLRLLPFIFFLTFLIIVYIANSYYAEKTIRQTEKVRKEIKELELEYISVKSDYMVCSKQSSVAVRLDSLRSGIKESVVPPKKIFVKIDTVKKQSK
jgi:hypothetical protein